MELELLVRVVVDRRDGPAFSSTGTWQALLEWQKRPDRAISLAPRLRQGPAGARRWDEVKGDWAE
jgi:hypothetical protein